jgi:hypothetical protein
MTHASKEEPDFFTLEPEKRYIPSEILSYSGKKIFCYEPFTFDLVHSIIIPVNPLEIFYFVQNYRLSLMMNSINYRIRTMLRCKTELDIDGENLFHEIRLKDHKQTLSMLLFHPRSGLDKLFRFSPSRWTFPPVFFMNSTLFSTDPSLVA